MAGAGKLWRRGRLACKQVRTAPAEAIRVGAALLVSDRNDRNARLSAWLNGLACTATARDYARWRQEADNLTDNDRAAIRQRCASLTHRPLLSVVMPTYRSNIAHLTAAIASVRAQLYENWELCIADDASPDPEIHRVLREFAAQDARIKVTFRATNGNISAASNSALDLAAGEFIALMDHDDLLPGHALYMIAEEINACPDVDIMYSDEDKIDEEGVRYSPHFKIGWNPDILLCQNMVNHLGVYRTALVRQIGGFRVGLEGSQDHDLALRAAEASRPERIRHIPWVLYHWRVFRNSGSFSATQSERAAAAARHAVTEHLKRQGEDAEVKASPYGYISIRRRVRAPLPSVTLCGLGDLSEGDLLPLREQVVADGLETEILLGSDALSLARQAQGNVLLFLDQPLDGSASQGMEPLIAHLQRAGVGSAGPVVLAPDGTLQQGPVAEAGGVLYAPYNGKIWETTGYFGRLHLPQECFSLVLNGLATRRDMLLDVGEPLSDPVSVARYCLALRRRGLSTVWEPGVVLKAKNRTRFSPVDTGIRDDWDGACFRSPCLRDEEGTFDFNPAAARVRPWKRA